MKISKKDLYDDDVYDLNEYSDYVLNWDDVDEYYWSVEKRPPYIDTNIKQIAQYLADQYKKDTRLMWSYNFDEAKEAKNGTFMFGHIIILNMKFKNGEIVRLSDDDRVESEIETIRKLLWIDSMYRHSDDQEYEDPF